MLVCMLRSVRKSVVPRPAGGLRASVTRQVSLAVILLASAFPAALIAGTEPVAAATQAYTVTDLGTLGGTYTVANAINDAGQVVGSSGTTSGTEDGFVWQNGTMTDLTLGGQDTEATAVSGSGLVAGYAYTSSNTYRHTFLWNSGTMTDLGTFPGSNESLGFGVNNNGAIVGDTQDGKAFLYQNGTWQNLSASSGNLLPQNAYGINDNGQVVGYAFASGSSFGHAFMWQAGNVTDLGTLGGMYSEARAINDNGQVVGQARRADGNDHPFLWQNGTMTDLGALDPNNFSNGEAFAINNQSSPEVVGESSYQGSEHAFVWQNGTMTDLNNVLVNGSAWSTLDVAYGVNDSGQIIGQGHLLDGEAHGFLLTPTSSPVPFLHPSVISFGNQRVGTTSVSSTVLFGNSGNASLTINSIGITGANAGDFAQTNNCGASLDPGASCLITVTFTPTAVGSRSATLSVDDSAAGSPTTAPLLGTGTAPAVGLSPSSLTFSGQNVGTTSAGQTVTITNTGTDTLNFGSPAIAIIGANTGDFAQTNTCGASLAVNASCTVSVSFTPTATGARNASLAINDDAAGSPQGVSLSGTGTAPAVSPSPNSVSFAGQSVGTTSAAQSVTLTNSGTGALSIASIGIGGTNAADFAQTNTCPASLAPGASCTISVTFSPSASGSRGATLSIADNAASSPQTVALSGAGLAADVALGISASPGSVKTGGTVTYTINVNDNAGPGNATGVTVTDALPANTSFVSASGGCSAASGKVSCSLGTLTKGSSTSVTVMVKVVSYTATITDSATATTSTTDPNTSNNTASVSIQGKH